MTKFKVRKKPRQMKKPVLREDTGIALAIKSRYLRKGERIINKYTFYIKFAYFLIQKYNLLLNFEL